MAYYLVDGWVDLLVWNEVDWMVERTAALKDCDQVVSTDDGMVGLMDGSVSNLVEWLASFSAAGMVAQTVF